jgi:hypothetical protein
MFSEMSNVFFGMISIYFNAHCVIYRRIEMWEMFQPLRLYLHQRLYRTCNDLFVSIKIY